MTFKLFPRIAPAVLRVRHAQRPRLERTGEPFDPRAHALRGSYVGLLSGLDAMNR